MGERPLHGLTARRGHSSWPRDTDADAAQMWFRPKLCECAGTTSALHVEHGCRGSISSKGRSRNDRS
eukprot:4422149-Alexandrium_andersonii.AAC.1